MKKTVSLILAGAIAFAAFMPYTYAAGAAGKQHKPNQLNKIVNHMALVAQKTAKAEKELEKLKKELAAFYRNEKKKTDIAKKLSQLKKKYGINDIQIFIDGKEIKLDVKPEIDKNGKNYWDRLIVPVRQVAQALGAKVVLEGDKITITKENTPNGKIEIIFQKGSNIALVNGKKLYLDKYVKKKGKELVLPMSVIIKLLDCKYQVDETGTIVFIDKTQIPSPSASPTSTPTPAPTATPTPSPTPTAQPSPTATPSPTPTSTPTPSPTPTSTPTPKPTSTPESSTTPTPTPTATPTSTPTPSAEPTTTPNP